MRWGQLERTRVQEQRDPQAMAMERTRLCFLRTTQCSWELAISICKVWWAVAVREVTRRGEERPCTI